MYKLLPVLNRRKIGELMYWISDRMKYMHAISGLVLCVSVIVFQTIGYIIHVYRKCIHTWRAGQRRFIPPPLILGCHLVFCFPNFLYFVFIFHVLWGTVAALRFRFILPPSGDSHFLVYVFFFFFRSSLSEKALHNQPIRFGPPADTIQHFTKRKKMEKRIKRQPDNDEHRALLSTGRQRQVKTR